MKLMEKFAAYVEKNKVSLSLSQQQTIIEANSIIPHYFDPKKINAIYIAVSSSGVSVFLNTLAPKPKNDGKKITIRLLGKTVDYQNYTSNWLAASRKTPTKQWYFIPKTGNVKKMDAGSGEWAMHNLNAQGLLVYLK